MNPIAIRLLSQQLVAPQFSDPAKMVSYMGAMQAQEYRMMRWAVEMRTRKPSAKAFKRAFDSGRIIRLHLMRGTWQLVAAEDYWMMIGLCAPKAIAVTKGWMSSNRISIPDEELMRVREILAQTAADLGSAAKEDLVRALADKDIRMDDHRLSYHIRMAEMSGNLCSGELLPMKATYALAADKVKPSTQMDKDEALMHFTRKYFQSRQPATLEDFVWWSGLNISDCRRGIALLGDIIHMEKWKGREFYLTGDCRTRGFRKGIPTTNTSSAISPVTLYSLPSTGITPITTAASSSQSSLTTELSAATGHHLGMIVRRHTLKMCLTRWTSARRGKYIRIIA